MDIAEESGPIEYPMSAYVSDNVHIIGGTYFGGVVALFPDKVERVFVWLTEHQLEFFPPCKAIPLTSQQLLIMNDELREHLRHSVYNHVARTKKCKGCEVCAICKGLMGRSMSISCGHKFHRDCLGKHQSVKSFDNLPVLCPTCGYQYEYKDLGG